MKVLGLPFLLALALGTPAYWALPRTWRLPTIAMLALCCLAWFAPVSAAFCLALAVASHALVRHQVGARQAYAAAAAMFAAMLLLRELLVRAGSASSLVPWLGAAFFTLRAAHYVIARGQESAGGVRFIDVFCYLFFPPTLLVGPVQDFVDFEREARRSRFDVRQLSAGLERLLFGYAKIVLLADYVVGLQLVAEVDSLAPGAIHTYLDCLDYGLALYFKFAGYSDVAIGFGLLLGIRLPENFDHPFLARNIADFWRRWNASVSAWCRDHVSFPLYARTRSSALSILVAMLVLGLWHECSPRYLLWGAYHGIVVWQQWRKQVEARRWLAGAAGRWPAEWLARLLTFNFVVVGFAITRAADPVQALQSLLQILGR
jgi:D-alanyl-lipoteichoic acid acyltransferase DltB (MBOAT superfamily)